ncbi:MAG: PilW family protein [Pseudomonas sp.]
MNNFRMQLGISLVELMIAMVISSFLILGVSQIYIDNKRNYLFQQGQAGNQENGRFTLQTFEQHISKAGFRRRPDDDFENSFKVDSTTITGCSFKAGQVITRPTDTGLSDKGVCIRYEPRDANEADCQGNLLSDTNNLNNPYTAPNAVFVEKIYLNSSSQLVCTSINPSDGAQVTGILAEGVEAIRFDFGIGDGNRTVKSYTATPDANADTIYAVRYSALMASPAKLAVNDSVAYTNWYGSSASAPTAGKLYQKVGNSISVRNLLP